MANRGIDREFSHIHIPKCGGSWVHNFFKHAYPANLVHSSHGTLSNAMPPFWMAWNRNTGPMKSGHPMFDVDWSKDSIKKFTADLRLPSPQHPGRFANSIRFSTSRNPFDWLVSYHCSNFDRVNDTHGIRSFQEFVEKFCDPTFRWWHYGLHQFMFYQMLDHEMEPAVHWVLRMENLKNAIDTMLLNHGADPAYLQERWKSFGTHTKSTKGNATPTREHTDHRFYYDDRLREIATTRFAPELSAFHYDFDGPTAHPVVIRTSLKDDGNIKQTEIAASTGFINLGVADYDKIRHGN